MNSDERWLDQDAGPVARPYALTGGRTRSRSSTKFELVDLIVATSAPAAGALAAGPEHRRLLRMCRRPVAVAELASLVDLPLGTVRVLLGDLAAEGLITVLRSPTDP